jgi:hypothetical protein
MLLYAGHSYERRAIEAWLKSNQTSPITGQILPSLDLVPNFALRNCIHELRQLMASSADAAADDSADAANGDEAPWHIAEDQLAVGPQRLGASSLGEVWRYAPQPFPAARPSH